MVRPVERVDKEIMVQPEGRNQTTMTVRPERRDWGTNMDPIPVPDPVVPPPQEEISAKLAALERRKSVEKIGDQVNVPRGGVRVSGR